MEYCVCCDSNPCLCSTLTAHLPSKSMAGYCPDCHSFCTSLDHCLCKAPTAPPPLSYAENLSLWHVIQDALGTLGPANYEEWQQIVQRVAAFIRSLDTAQQRIEVSGVESRNAESPIDRVVRSGAHERHTTDDKSTTAGVATGLTSSLTREQALQLLDRYAAASIDRWCTGELKPQVDAAAEACFVAFGIDTAKARSADWMRSQSLDAPTNINPPRSYESQASTVLGAHGTAQHVAPASPSIPSGCGSGVSQGLNIGSEPSVPNAPNAVPLSEQAIRAVVYGCTDAQCVCGRCEPIRVAVDPWQGLGKTWSDK